MTSPITTFRTKANVTRAELAALLDVTPGFVGELERGEFVPSAPHVERMTELFGIRPDAFLQAVHAHRAEIRQAAECKLERPTPQPA